MSTFVWPTEDGWPYPDTAAELVDLNGEADDDLLSLRVTNDHLLDSLSPLEREVVESRFGLRGHPERSMRDLAMQTGLSSGELRGALGSGLAKLRLQFQS